MKPTFEVPVEALVVLSSAAKEASRYTMQHVELEAKGDTLLLNATDGKILSTFEWQRGTTNDRTDGKYLVPVGILKDAAKAAKQLSSRSTAACMYVSFEEKAVVVDVVHPYNGERKFTDVRPEGRFPPCDSVRAAEMGFEVTLAADILQRIVDAAKANGDSKAATFYFSPIDAEKGRAVKGIAFRSGQVHGTCMPITRDVEPAPKAKAAATPVAEPTPPIAADPREASRVDITGPSDVAGDRQPSPPGETTVTSTEPTRARHCNACSSEGPIHGRGLCKRCYRKSHAAAKATAQIAAVS